MPLTGSVVEITTRYAGSELTDDVTAGASEITLDSVADLPPTGSLRLTFLDPATGDEDTEDIGYTDIDEDERIVTLDGTLVNAYPAEATATVLPLAPITTVDVEFDPEFPPVTCFLPEQFKTTYTPWFADQTYESGMGPEVVGDEVGGQQSVIKVLRVPSLLDTVALEGEIDAAQNPIRVSNNEGEGADHDADGFSTYTNNPVPVRTIGGRFPWVAAAGTNLFVIGGSGNLRKFDLETGAEVTGGGFPKTGPFSRIATDGVSVFAVDASNDIRSYDVGSGTEDVTGFPIAGTFGSLAASGGRLFAVDSADDIRSYDSVTGVQDTTNFPKTGTYLSLAAADGRLFAADIAGDVHSFNALTGVEDVTNFPVTDPVGINYITVVGGKLFGSGGYELWIRAFDALTGDEDTTLYPINVAAFGPLAAASDYLCGVDLDSFDVRVFNLAEGFQSSSVDSGDGSARFADLTVPAGVISKSAQIFLSGAATPTSTTDIYLSHATLTLKSRGPGDVFEVYCNPRVSIGIASSINIIECLIDGVVQTGEIRTSGPASLIVNPYRMWRVTGLEEGDHIIGFRTRNTAGSTSATITLDTMIGWRWIA